MHFLAIAIAFGFSIGIANTAQASYVDSAKIQYAGEIGFISLGVTKDITSWYEISLLYGYVPEFVSEKDVHTLALKQDFNIYTFSLLKNVQTFYLGGTLYRALNERYDARKQVDHVDTPTTYYAKPQQPFLLYWGLKMRRPELNYSVFFEAGINENWLPHYFKRQWLTHHFKSKKPINADKRVSLSLGFNYYF